MSVSCVQVIPGTMTINEIVKGLAQDPNRTRARMLKAAIAEVLEDLKVSDYKLHVCEFDTRIINYSHFCEVLGWPDFQDGGIFEQIIEAACTAACMALGYKAKYVE